MKKSIPAILLILSVFAGFTFAQTTKKKKIVRSGAKKVVTVRKTTTRKIMTTPKSAAVTTESGLTYIVTEHGAGAQVKAGDTVVANYTGLLTSGLKFDSSLDRSEPFSFPVGAGKVIKGWDEAFQKLRVGDRAILTIPAALGYGTRGAGGVIPPGATLIFIVEVVGVK